MPGHTGKGDLNKIRAILQTLRSSEDEAGSLHLWICSAVPAGNAGTRQQLNSCASSAECRMPTLVGLCGGQGTEKPYSIYSA